ncbi:MAG: EsaB/YukD family protein [Bacteroidota bacterium]
MEEISITVRIMPTGDEVEVELPLSTTGGEIIESLLDANYAPKTDPEGGPITYELISKMSNSKIGNDKTLQDVRVRAGETLYLTPKLVAGIS